MTRSQMIDRAVWDAAMPTMPPAIPAHWRVQEWRRYGLLKSDLKRIRQNFRRIARQNPSEIAQPTCAPTVLEALLDRRLRAWG